MSDLIFADVSEWQGAINWSKYVQANNLVASVRAYNGTRADEWFDPDTEQSNRLNFWAAGGRALGIYSYLVKNEVVPVATQANAFCATVGSLRPGEFPILDIEEAATTTQDLSRVASTWRQIVQAQLKTEPWLYTYLSFYQEHNLAAAGFAPERIIVAAYEQNEPTSPAHGAWQFSDTYGPMPGITSRHDANIFHGTLAQLLAIIGTGTVVQPPATAQTVPFPGVGAFVLGHSNPNVTLMGQWLVDRGYGRFYQAGPGPVLGEHDIEACRQFQLDQGWTGDDANGIPGPVTWARLQNPDTRPVAHPLVPFPGVGAFVLGHSNPNVTLLGQWLVNKGYGRFYEVGPGPVMGQADVNACAAFQKAQGWTGSDANGYPGPETWERLQQ